MGLLRYPLRKLGLEKMVKVVVTLLTVAAVCLAVTSPVDCGIAADAAATEILTKCMAGTKLEAKLKEGLGTCSGAPHSSWDRNNCPPTYELSLSQVETVHADEACVLKSLGWLDAENKLRKEAIREDLASLPKIAAEFDVDKYKDCLTYETIQLKSDRCAGNFEGEELATLTKAITRVVRYHCVVHRLLVSCSNAFLGA